MSRPMNGLFAWYRRACDEDPDRFPLLGAIEMRVWEFRDHFKLVGILECETCGHYAWATASGLVHHATHPQASTWCYRDYYDGVSCYGPVRSVPWTWRWRWRWLQGLCRALIYGAA